MYPIQELMGTGGTRTRTRPTLYVNNFFCIGRRELGMAPLNSSRQGEQEYALISLKSLQPNFDPIPWPGVEPDRSNWY